MTVILYFQTIATFVFGELLFHADPKGGGAWRKGREDLRGLLTPNGGTESWGEAPVELT
jgi:hypothetical protein